jgi:hypothetical protein
MSARFHTDPLRSVELGPASETTSRRKLRRAASHRRGVEHYEAHRRRGRDAEETGIAGRGSDPGPVSRLALRSCNSACLSAGRTFGGRGFRIVHIFCIRNLRNLASSADHGARAVLAFGFSASLAVSHEFVSGTHQAFASIPIVEDASTRRGYAKSIPGDASLFAERLGPLQDCCVIDFCHPDAPGVATSLVRVPTGTAMAGEAGETDRPNKSYHPNINISASTTISMPAVISDIADRFGESENAIAGRGLTNKL